MNPTVPIVSDVFVFAGKVNAHHTEWLEFDSPTGWKGPWCSCFLQSVGLCAVGSLSTHISGYNRLDLVMTDAPDIV